MTTAPRLIFFCSLVSFALLTGVHAAQSAPILPLPATAQPQQPPDVVAIAYDRARRDMSFSKWKEHVETARKHLQYTGKSPNEFLDEALLNLAFAARNGEINDLKQVVYWVALYRPFKALPPPSLYELAQQYRHDLDELLADFSWEKASALAKRIRSN